MGVFGQEALSQRQETMRTLSVMRFVIYGAVGCGIGWAVAGFLNSGFIAITAPMFPPGRGASCRLGGLHGHRISHGSLPGHVGVRLQGRIAQARLALAPDSYGSLPFYQEATLRTISASLPADTRKRDTKNTASRLPSIAYSSRIHRSRLY